MTQIPPFDRRGNRIDCEERSPMEKLMVVEDEPALRNQLKTVLGEGCAIVEATDRAGAVNLFLQHIPRVVVLDLGLPPDPEGSSEGLRCLEWIIRMRPSTKVVLLASTPQREDAWRALECGAYDFHTKPVLPAELQVVIRRAFHLCEVEEQSRELKEALERAAAGKAIAGQCDALSRLFPPRQVIHLLASGGTEAVVHHPMVLPGATEAEGTLPDRESAGGPAGPLTLKEARDKVEKRMVSDAIGNCGGNMTRASELLGVSRPALYDLMKKYGLCRGGVAG